MHLTRSEVSPKLPIPRKGTKYVARANTDVKNSVPVVIALRDMLHLARTAKEVQEIIKQKIVKINGRTTNDYHASIKLFNVFEAGKSYVLTLNDAGKFHFEEVSSPKERLCKVIGKKILKGKKVQLNFHDGSNILTKENIAINDSAYLNFEGKLSSHVKLEKGSECIIISGKYLGAKGKIEEVKAKTCLVKMKDNSRELKKEAVVAL